MHIILCISKNKKYIVKFSADKTLYFCYFQGCNPMYFCDIVLTYELLWLMANMLGLNHWTPFFFV